MTTVPGTPYLPSATGRRQWRERRALVACLAVAAGLVLIRTAVPLIYEQVFDSDQAIVGLMAKHLSEFRSFPLFFYGQNYMLGVQAWIAAPCFWLGGPTVAMLRLPLVLFNVGVACGLILIFTRLGVRPVFALVTALPILATTPTISLELMSNLGASIEPFAYVLLLWGLRRRPVAFGVLFGVATLHREFTWAVLPALAVAQWRTRGDWSPLGVAKGAGAFAAVWIVVDLLKQQVNTFGPAGGAFATGSLALGPATIAKWLSFRWEPYLGREVDLVMQGGPELFGARSYVVGSAGLPEGFAAGSTVAAGLLVAALVACAVRLIWMARRPGMVRRGGDSRVAVYLAMIGGATVVAYGLNGGIQAGAPTVFRYVLFALLLPVAFFGGYFQLETGRAWRSTVALLIALWAGCNVWDNARLAYACAATPTPRHHRIMADYLVAKGIKYGRAGYWDCYVINFLSRERVTLASTSVVRISSYQAAVDRHAEEAVTLVRQPCKGGTPVDAWCVADPKNR